MFRLSLYRRRQLQYLIADALSALLIWLLFLSFRWLVYEGRIFSVDTILIPSFNFYQPLLLYPLGCLCIYYLSGHYLRVLQHTYSYEAFNTLGSAIIITFIAFFCIIVDDKVENYSQYYISLGVLLGIQFTVSYLPRIALTMWIHKNNKKSTTAFIGTKQALADLQTSLGKQQPTITITPEQIDQFASLQGQYNIQHTIVATEPTMNEKEIFTIIQKIYPYRTKISLSPRIYDMLIGAAKIEQIADTPLISVTEPPMNDIQLCCKRAFDIVVSCFCLVLLSPLLLVIALAIKIDSNGKIIYKQERIGMYGKCFNILKFRTMQANAEQGAPQLSQQNDPRITRVGHVLRKYRLDELPQFWNIVRGDMSIVGPRPERAFFIDKIVEKAPYYCLIYKIRPGLTSWGPIKVGYTDTLEKMIQRLNYDIVYMENMSLLLDIKIMFHTLKVIIDGKGQ